MSEKGYTIVTDQYPLSVDCAVLLGEIARFSYKTGYCFMSNSKLAERHSVKARTLQKWLAILSEQDLIDIKYSDKKERQIYISKKVLTEVKSYCRLQAFDNKKEKGKC